MVDCFTFWFSCSFSQFFSLPFFSSSSPLFFFIHSFIRTQGFLLAAPFATPAIRGFNAAQLVAVEKSHTTSMTGVFAATFQGSFNDSLGQCTGPAVVDSIAIVTFCLFSFYCFSFYFYSLKLTSVCVWGKKQKHSIWNNNFTFTTEMHCIDRNESHCTTIAVS